MLKIIKTKDKSKKEKGKSRGAMQGAGGKIWPII